ncbi:hypothetical protein F1D05_37290 [Kribbella qitaiheensis]|uniref:Fibronectin type-III domain-containing protein n=1 Tax=Kribbella qitaiheensis TaxID=1544730 RepID=A0A7G6X8G4_9ACTN|nr:fibronectin type III domain-containing protein [Kribbella qitaiheensis]QNE22529.1 hypothetical protein F1D05_37290 [Kribbella qitaiheensis]
MRSFSRLAVSLTLIIGSGVVAQPAAIGASTASASSAAATATTPPGAGVGQFIPFASLQRMLDTGAAIGVPTTTVVPAQGSVTVKFTGRSGVPASGVRALHTNISILGPTATGNLPAWATAETQPAVTNVHFYAGTAYASSASVIRLNAGGQATFRNNSSGTLRLVVDVMGYYTTEAFQGTGNRFVPLKQAAAVAATSVAANTALTVSLLGKGGLPSEAGSIAAVAINVTAKEPTAAGGWTLYPAGITRPSGGHGNFIVGRTKTNSAVVPLSADGRLSLYNISAKAVFYVIDVVGYYTAATNAAVASSRVLPVAPSRILDSGAATLIQPNAVYTFPVAGKGGLPVSGLAAAALHVITQGSATFGGVTVYPSVDAVPSPLDVATAMSNTYSFNLVWARIGANGSVSLINRSDSALRIWVDVEAYATQPTRPDPPGPVMTSPGDSRATVTWPQPDNTGDLPIASYEVVAMPSGATQTSMSNSAVFQGLTNGTSYAFRVRARNAVGWSEYSAASQGTTPRAPLPPGAPFITGVIPRDSGATVSWSAPAGADDQIASYTVTTVPTTSTVNLPGTARTAMLSGLENTKSYQVVVKATNANGSSASPPLRVIPQAAQVPLRPAALLVTALDARLDVQWVQPADGGASILDYEIVAEPGNLRVISDPGTTISAFTGLQNGAEYTVKVRARNKAGSGNWSEQRATPSASRVAAAPTDLQVVPATSGAMKVSWEAPTDTGTSAITGYRVSVSPSGRVVETSNPSVTIDGLDTETQYTFSVQAVSSAGVGAASTPSSPLAPKVNLKVNPITLTAESARLIVAVSAASFSVTNPNPQLNSVRPDSFLIAPASPATPQGFLRKVLRVTQAGGGLIFETEDAPLNSIIQDGGFSRDIRLTTSDVQGLLHSAPGVVLREPTVRGLTAKQGAGTVVVPGRRGKVEPVLRLEKGKIVLEVGRDFERGFRGEVTATFEPETQGHVHMSSSGVGSSFSLKVTSGAEFRLDAAIGKKVERRIPLGEMRGTCIDIQIGAAPVVTCPAIQLALTLDAEMRAGLSVVVNYSKTDGVEIVQEGAGLPNARSLSTPAETTVSAARFFGNAEVSLGLEGALVLRFYGAVGPLLGLKPYVRAEIDTEADEWFNVYLGVALSAGLTLDIFTKNLVRWEKDDILKAEYRILSSNSRFTGVLISPGGAELSVGEQVDFDATFIAVPNSSLSWRIIDGDEYGTIDANGRFAAIADGIVTVEAATPDPLGYRSTVNVLVGPHAPSEPRDVRAVAGNLSANVSWQPPENLGGAPVSKYVLTTDPDTGSREVPGVSLSTAIGGLTQGVSYTVEVTAVTSNGAGRAGVSNAIVAHESLFSNPLVNNLAAGVSATVGYGGPEISDSGRYGFFSIRVDGLSGPEGIPADGKFYLVRRDLITGQILLVSRQSDGKTPQPVSTGMVFAQSDYAASINIDSKADGRFVAYLVDGSRARSQIMVYDAMANTTWVAGADIGQGVLSVRLSADGGVVAFSTEYENPTSSSSRTHHILRVAKGGTPKQVDICVDSASCGRSNPNPWLSPDGNTVVYTAYSNSPNNHDWNQHVFYNAATGASTMPYLNQGISFSPVFSDDGQYFVGAAHIGLPADQGQGAIVVKRRDGGPVTEADVVTTFPWWHVVAVNGISSGGNVVIWSNRSAPEPDGSIMTLRANGVRLPVFHPPNLELPEATTINMSTDGGTVGWLKAGR